MKKIDLFTHVLPQAFLDHLAGTSGGMPPSLQGILRIRSALYDMDRRRKVMEEFPGYVQVLTLSVPPIEALVSPAETVDLARCANDSMAELVEAYPDHFIGFVASLPLDDVDASIEEAERAMNDLGAFGAHICTNVNGVALDDPRFEPLFAHMAEVDRPLWVHPYRTDELPDYASETTSRFGMWMAYGWPYETTVFMSRVVLHGYLDRYPRLRIVTHHGGGMVPQFAHRIGAGLHDLPPLAGEGESPAADHEELQQRVIARYRRFYADTAAAAERISMQTTLSFFGADQVVFATDMPFDPDNGPRWIRDTIAELDAMDLTDEQRHAIYEGNARRLLGLDDEGVA